MFEDENARIDMFNIYQEVQSISQGGDSWPSLHRSY